MTNEQEKQWLEEFYSTFPKHAGIIEMHKNGAIGHLDAMTAIHQFSVWKAAKESSQSIIDAKDKEIEELKAHNARLVEMLKEADGWFEYLSPTILPDALHRKAFDDFAWKLESIITAIPQSPDKE